MADRAMRLDMAGAKGDDAGARDDPYFCRVRAMPANVTVRPMRPGDCSQVATLAVQLGYPATTAEIEHRFRSLGAKAESAVLVAEGPTGEVEGWVHVLGRSQLISAPQAVLAGLVVDAGCRRRGVGRALVEAAERWAAGRGYTTVRVRSNVVRPDALPFYERLGYEVAKTQYVFRKTLR